MTFQRGQSGNPGGRPKETADVRALARKHLADSINGLAAIARDKKQPGTTRVAAYNSLLDRAVGRPAQAVAGPDGEGPVAIEIRWMTGEVK